jgi:hypothetical protein
VRFADIAGASRRCNIGEGGLLSRVKFLFPRWARLGRESQARNAPPYVDKRRAERVSASVSVLIYGHLGNEPFQEATETINVSGRGGLITISTRISPAQKLIITNLRTDEDQPCRVARLIQGPDGGTFAGLEFLQPAPQFWRS